jgi:hypothetical protein
MYATDDERIAAARNLLNHGSVLPSSELVNRLLELLQRKAE